MKKAQWLTEIMVTHIVDTSRVFNRSICAEYDTIVKKITAQSETTEQLVEQEAYVEFLQTGEMYTLRVGVEMYTLRVGVEMYTLRVGVEM